MQDLNNFLIIVWARESSCGNYFSNKAFTSESISGPCLSLENDRMMSVESWLDERMLAAKRLIFYVTFGLAGVRNSKKLDLRNKRCMFSKEDIIRGTC